MAENIVIAASLKVDTGNANANVKDLNKNLVETKGNLKETGAAAKNTGKDVEGAGGSFSNLKDKISGLPGPLGQAGEGVNKLSSTFKALLANPVVLVLSAIVGALALLYKAFTSTNDGADKMEQIFAGLGATLNVLRDRVLTAAGAIAKFFTGDFKGALADARSSVNGIGEEISREFAAAAKATQVLQDLDDEMRNLGVSRAKLNRDLRAAKELLSDENASYGQKKKAIEEVRIAEGKQTEAELDGARRKLKAIQDQNALSDKSDEALQAEADAQAAVYQLEEKSAADRDRLNKQSSALDRAERAKRLVEERKHLEEKNKLLAEAKAKEKEINDAGNKAIADAEKVLEKGLDREGQLALLKQEYEAKAELARAANINALRIYEAYQQERNTLEQKFADEDAENQKVRDESKEKFLADLAEKQIARITADDERNKKKAEADAAIDKLAAENKIKAIESVGDSLGKFADIAGRQTVIGKALAVAQSTIATYQSAVQSYNSLAGIPLIGPALGAIAAAAAVAAGIANVKKILAVQVPGGGGGSAPNPNVPSAPIAPQRSSTAIDQASISEIGNAAAPVRAFLLDSDVENHQERNTRLSRAARLGG